MATAQPSASSRDARRARGDFPTPPELVARVLDHTLPTLRAGDTVRVLDPTCGDGRFLLAAGERIRAAGAWPCLHGVERHRPAADAARAALAAAGFGAASRIDVADVRTYGWPAEPFDVVVGNPPFRSPLVDGHAAGADSAPYADLATEVLALAVRLTRPDGGRVGLVLPQSVLAARDAAPVRSAIDGVAERIWSWWSSVALFEASVFVCAVTLERCLGPRRSPAAPWTAPVTTALAVPELGPIRSRGVLGDRARLTANFRDQYYGLVGAVRDDGAGPPLVTSGLIDPGVCTWGHRPVRFAGVRYRAPRVDLAALTPRMQRWAAGLLVPKVVVANQARVVEAVADPDGAWLPSVPVLTARPHGGADVGEVAAVLTSPVASCWAWHRAAGTGRSPTAIRLGPRWFADLPWPEGDASEAVAALSAGDVVGCGRAVLAAYGRAGDEALLAWWRNLLPARAAARPDSNP